jgi:hypothetical protein
MSLPSSAATSLNCSRFQCNFQAMLAANNAADASLEPPPKPEAGGNALGQMCDSAELAATSRLQQTERPNDEILANVSRQTLDVAGSAVHVQFNIACVAWLEGQGIEQVDGDHQRFNFMKAVGPFGKYFQKKVQLGRSKYPQAWAVLANEHGASQCCGTIRWGNPPESQSRRTSFGGLDFTRLESWVNCF